MAQEKTEIGFIFMRVYFKRCLKNALSKRYNIKCELLAASLLHFFLIPQILTQPLKGKFSLCRHVIQWDFYKQLSFIKKLIIRAFAPRCLLKIPLTAVTGCANDQTLAQDKHMKFSVLCMQCFILSQTAALLS